MGHWQNFPKASGGKRFQRPLLVWGPGVSSQCWDWAQLEAVSPTDSITFDQGHREVLWPCHALRELGDAVANAQRGANYSNICFPHRY